MDAKKKRERTEFMITASQLEESAWNEIRTAFGGLSHAQTVEGLIKLFHKTPKEIREKVMREEVRPRGTLANGVKLREARSKKKAAA